MRAVLYAHSRVVDKTHVGFVDQGRRLKRVAHSLPSHMISSQAFQLLVDQRDQLIQSGFVSVTPIEEQLGDLPLDSYRHLFLIRRCFDGKRSDYSTFPNISYLNSAASGCALQ